MRRVIVLLGKRVLSFTSSLILVMKPKMAALSANLKIVLEDEQREQKEAEHTPKTPSAVFWVCEGVRFGQLCSGNPSNSRRTSDIHGEGRYGARRQGRTHEGLDIICRDGSTVYAPFDVTLRRKVIVYGDPAKAAIDQGIEMEGEGLRFKLFYVRPDRTSGTVRKGERIGVMLPMQSVYPRITSHIHVQMNDKSDPTPYF